jgi:deoxyhypusine synthase
VPHFGGASGSSLEEAQSWGKLSVESDKVSVQADATIALPVLVSALATSAGKLLAKRKKPAFDMKKRPMTVDGKPVRSDKFEE